MKGEIWILIGLLLGFSGPIATAQQWETIGFPWPTGVSSFAVESQTNTLYAGGAIPSFANPPHHVARLEGGDWIPLGNNPGTQAWTCAWFQGELYFGYTGIRKWTGTAYEQVGGGIPGQVRKLLVIGDSLYAFGNFTEAGGIPTNSIAIWDGTAWHPFDAVNIDKMDFNPIVSAAVFQNQLYIGGQIRDTSIATDRFNLFRLVADSLERVGPGIVGAASGVWTMHEYQGLLYVAGSFGTDNGNPENNIVAWDGTSWHTVGGGLLGGTVWALEEHAGYLWAGGSFDSAGGIDANYVAKWDGTTWCRVTHEATFDGHVLALQSFNDTLYAGGGFFTVHGDTCYGVARWADASWSDSCQTVGIERQQTFATNVHVFPNPVASLLTIEAQDILGINVYDLHGKVMISQPSTAPKQVATLDVEDLPNGLYLLIIRTRQGTQHSKIVVASEVPTR